MKNLTLSPSQPKSGQYRQTDLRATEIEVDKIIKQMEGSIETFHNDADKGNAIKKGIKKSNSQTPSAQ